MNRSDIIRLVSEKNGINKKKAEEIVVLIIDLMKDTLISGEKVQITGFGTFEIKEMAPRIGRNPKTNEEVRIDAFRKPVFRPSLDLKSKINVSKKKK